MFETNRIDSIYRSAYKHILTLVAISYCLLGTKLFHGTVLDHVPCQTYRAAFEE